MLLIKPMKSFLTTLTFLLALAAPAVAQTEVTPYQPGVTLEGVTYFLPQTALRVTIEAERTQTQPGRLAKYAFRYLRLDDVPMEATTQWTLKNIRVEAYGVPDKAKGYSVKLKNRTVAPLVTLSREGILLSVNAEQAEEVLSATPQSVKGQAPLDASRYLSQEMLAAGSTAKMAELVAQEIYDLRDKRKDLIAGEAENTPKDGVQLQLMLQQLDQQAEALEQLFKGSQQVSTEYFTFNYLPSQTGQRDVLCRFSTVNGPVDAANLLGNPIFVQLTNLEQLPLSMPDAETAKKKAKQQEGVWYNVPARCNVRLFTLDNNYVDTDIAFGQFGHLELLSNVLFDKKATTRVILHQSNGGVKKIEN